MIFSKFEASLEQLNKKQFNNNPYHIAIALLIIKHLFTVIRLTYFYNTVFHLLSALSRNGN